MLLRELTSLGQGHRAKKNWILLNQKKGAFFLSTVNMVCERGALTGQELVKQLTWLAIEPRSVLYSLGWDFSIKHHPHRFLLDSRVESMSSCWHGRQLID